MQLRELQRAFQDRVLLGEHAIEPEFHDRHRSDFDARLDVYVGGYRTRLIEALGTTYPVLKAALGDEFEQRMRVYIDSTPSRHYSVRHYGAGVAQHLVATDPGGAGSVLAELARWEWTLADVFDAPDDESLTVAALAAVPPAAWPTLSFALRACVRRFETHTNVVQWWRAANGLCDAPDRLAEAIPVPWLLWRRGVKTLFRSLDEVEATLLDEAGAGATFGMLCERMADTDASAVALRAASLLRGWVADELLVAYSWSNSK
jgi:hypothetical protein